VLLVNIPQIVAAVVILAKYWADETCGPSETLKWRTYALIAATRMALYVSTVTAMYHLNGRLHPMARIMRFLSHARNGLDAFGACLGKAHAHTNTRTSAGRVCRLPLTGRTNALPVCLPCLTLPSFT